MPRKKSLITFSPSEKELLDNLLGKRIQSTREYGQTIDEFALKKKFEKFYLEPCLTAQFKVSRLDKFPLTSQEKLACTSVINEHKPNFYSELERLQTTQNPTHEILKNAMRLKLECCNSILRTCNPNSPRL